MYPLPERGRRNLFNPLAPALHRLADQGKYWPPDRGGSFEQYTKETEHEKKSKLNSNNQVQARLSGGRWSRREQDRFHWDETMCGRGRHWNHVVDPQFCLQGWHTHPAAAGHPGADGSQLDWKLPFYHSLHKLYSPRRGGLWSMTGWCEGGEDTKPGPSPYSGDILKVPPRTSVSPGSTEGFCSHHTAG